MGHYKRTISIAFHCIRWCRALHSIAKHHCIARVDCTGPSINEGTGRWIRGHHLPLTCRYPIVLVDRAEIFSVYIFEICCKTIVCLFSAETTIESPSTLKLTRHQADRRSTAEQNHDLHLLYSTTSVHTSVNRILCKLRLQICLSPSLQLVGCITDVYLCS